MIIKSVKSTKLSEKDIYSICKLKNTFWKYGLKSNLSWFKKNIKNNDIHNILYISDKIIGYTLLRKRLCLINHKKHRYLYFDTLIIDKNFRKKKLGNILMHFNNEIIKQENNHSFLICKKKLSSFYKKYNWTNLKNKDFNILDYQNEVKSNRSKEKKINSEIIGMRFNYQLKKI